MSGIRIQFVPWMVVAALCLPGVSRADTAQQHPAHKTSKKPQPAPVPLPPAPQGPVPQLPLDAVPPLPPQVSYQNGQLAIVAKNSTLGDILRAVRKLTSAEVDIPASANERVVTQLGPGPARDVLSALLNGSHFNYVLLGSATNTEAIERVVLVPKSGPDNPASPAGSNSEQPIVGQAVAQPGYGQPMAQPDAPTADEQDAADADATDSADTDATPDQAEAPPPDQPDGTGQDQSNPQQPGVQPGVKTPQQILQELQQRQLMQQQQQPPGQPQVVYPIVQQPPPQN